MNNSMFVEATAADALTIIGLRRRIWDTTYRGIYPDSMILIGHGTRRKNCQGSIFPHIPCI